VAQTFYIYTLGCKLNFSESSFISGMLQKSGFVSDDKKPDFILVNSCAVTEAAVKKVRNLVAGLHRQHPNANIIVLGCYSALYKEIVAQWEGVTKVFGSEDKSLIIDYLTEQSQASSTSFFSTYSFGDRTRSFLKIQDGCDYHCSYCTVAKARGKSRSDSIANVLKKMIEIDHLGIKEVVLTGVNTGDFGKTTGETFYNLLQEIDKQKRIERIRISSIEPNLLENRIIDLCAESAVFMPHFHIPLQSGSDKILQLMGRRYDTRFFREKLQYITEKMPDVCIALDVISGFPEESNEDFEDSYNFIKSLPIAYLHVFSYSVRPNTTAAAMKQVKASIKKDRTLQLLQLSEEKQNDFYQRFIGCTRPVLLESTNYKGMMHGFTDNYIKVSVPYKKEWENSIQNILIPNFRCPSKIGHL
jgi:threonylcarbamoyladenosine tRNA methylthiotransferase MtaB